MRMQIAIVSEKAMRCLRATRKIGTAFGRESAAVAIVEFAVVMPVLVVFMLGASEMARYVNATRQITNLANSYATLLAVRQTNLTYNDAVFVYNSAVVTFPSVLKDAKRNGVAWQNDISVTLSSVQMSKANSSCVLNCTYNAKVVWSLNSPTAGTRSCTVAPKSVADTNAPSLQTLPQDIFNPGSIVVADVVYTYIPVFGAAYVPKVTIRRSAYLAPRYLSTLHYNNSGSGDPFKECP